MANLTSWSKRPCRRSIANGIAHHYPNILGAMLLILLVSLPRTSAFHSATSRSVPSSSPICLRQRDCGRTMLRLEEEMSGSSSQLRSRQRQRSQTWTFLQMEINGRSFHMLHNSRLWLSKVMSEGKVRLLKERKMLKVLVKAGMLAVVMFAAFFPSVAAHASTAARSGEIAAAAAASIAAPMGTASGTVAVRPVSTMVELQLTLRLVYAAVVGAALGKERSLAKHSAGVRTMALVAMGASAFTVCSAYGFLHLPGRCDPSRMAANVASGVGFVGAGVITTTSAQQQQQGKGGSSPQLSTNVVHGLTTAATIWLSAAVGVACGVGLYAVATTAALTTISVLRLGRTNPKASTQARAIGKEEKNNSQEQTQIIGGVDAKLGSGHYQQSTSAEDDHHNAEHYAETHDTSEWDEHPHHDRGHDDDETDEIMYDDHDYRDLPQLPKSGRKPYVSKQPRRHDEPVIRIVKNAWEGSNGTSDNVLFTYDDVQDLSLEELEKFIKKRRASSFFWDRSDTPDDRLSP